MADTLSDVLLAAALAAGAVAFVAMALVALTLVLMRVAPGTFAHIPPVPATTMRRLRGGWAPCILASVFLALLVWLPGVRERSFDRRMADAAGEAVQRREQEERRDAHARTLEARRAMGSQALVVERFTRGMIAGWRVRIADAPGEGSVGVEVWCAARHPALDIRGAMSLPGVDPSVVARAVAIALNEGATFMAEHCGPGPPR